MTRRALSLRARLGAAFALVVVVGLAVLATTTRLITPLMFNYRLGHGPHGNGAGNGPVHAALFLALNWSLVIAVPVSLAVATLVATFAARRILRPLEAVRAATRRLAAGRYGERAPSPAEPELAALAQDVNHLAQALAETETRRANLIGDLAHELRTPVTSLRGLLEGALDGVIPTEAGLFASALEETGRLERLADDLVALSRADEGALNLRLQPVDLGELVTRAARRLQPQFDQQDVVLSVVGAEPVPAMADPERIAQLVTNLLGNALRAAAPHRAAARQGTVEIRAQSTDAGARVTVADNGVGLAPEELPLVFDRFWRGADPGGPGSGIGLTIARAIAQAHGGALHATSPGIGHGACFVLELPACDEPTGHREPADAP